MKIVIFILAAIGLMSLAVFLVHVSRQWKMILNSRKFRELHENFPETLDEFLWLVRYSHKKQIPGPFVEVYTGLNTGNLFLQNAVRLGVAIEVSANEWHYINGTEGSFPAYAGVCTQTQTFSVKPGIGAEEFDFLTIDDPPKLFCTVYFN